MTAVAQAAASQIVEEEREMPAKGSSLHLVKSGPGKMVKRPIFRTDEMVPRGDLPG